MKQEDIAYIQGISAGDRMVFTRLFNEWYEPLCRYCMRIIHDQDEAEEIVQDVFVKLWVKRNELSIEHSMKAYLYRTVMNKAINYNKHQKIKKIHQMDVISTSGDFHQATDRLMEAELHSLYETAIANMPKKRKEVFILSRKEGLKYTEIADRMGISIKTVEAHLTKALEELRNRLQEYLPVMIASVGLIKYIFEQNTG